MLNVKSSTSASFQVIDDDASAMKDASTLLNKTVPLGELLDDQLARAKENKLLKLIKLLKLKIMS